jgi:hypothetical protein
LGVSLFNLNKKYLYEKTDFIKKITSPSGGFDFSKLESSEEYKSHKQKLIKHYKDNIDGKFTEDEELELAKSQFSMKEEKWKEALKEKKIGTEDILSRIKTLVDEGRQSDDRITGRGQTSIKPKYVRSPDQTPAKSINLRPKKDKEKVDLGNFMKMSAESFNDTLEKFKRKINS